MLTYTFKIKTNKTLEDKFFEHLNTTRCIYNLAKETKEIAYSKGVKLGKYDLINQLPELKKEFEWMKVVSSNTLQGTIERLYKGYDKFFRDLKAGIKTSKPHWASRGKWKSVEFKQGNLKTKPTLRFKNSKFNLPKIGLIKVFKSREVYGNIKIARVVKRADGWYLQVVTDYEQPKCESQAEVGCDLGITHFLVTSDGEYFENIKTTQRFKRQLRIEQRSLSRKKKGSNNWYKQVNRVAKTHLKIKRVREDYLHKVSKQLANNYQYVFLEDLDVKEMVKDKNYSKSISDVSWSKFSNYLEYKTNLIKVDAKYSSQECNSCGHISKENRKTQEHFKCVKCGFEMNADEKASLTILKRGQSLLYANAGQ